VRYHAAPAAELYPPAMTHHRLILLARPPEQLDLLYEGVKRRVPEVAADAGFSDQSQFSHHFKRLVGVTPGQFRGSARTAQKAARDFKSPRGGPSTIRS
jgi:AraC-like DNA-binding protein